MKQISHYVAYRPHLKRRYELIMKPVAKSFPNHFCAALIDRLLRACIFHGPHFYYGAQNLSAPYRLSYNPLGGLCLSERS